MSSVSKRENKKKNFLLTLNEEVKVIPFSTKWRFDENFQESEIKETEKIQ